MLPKTKASNAQSRVIPYIHGGEFGNLAVAAVADLGCRPAAEVAKAHLGHRLAPPDSWATAKQSTLLPVASPADIPNPTSARPDCLR